MRWYYYLVLGLSGFLLSFFVAQFQPAPGYMDADYYFEGGVQLAEGHGFREMVLWNYLDDPAGLPHPSHGYWMPLASILAALGMGFTRNISLSSARLGFFLLAMVIPPTTALLSYNITNRRDLALCAGFLAVFSGYYVPFFSTTDTFSIYMALGVVFFLLIGWGILREDSRCRYLISLGLGVIAGLAHLTRADGALWLVMALLSVLLLPKSTKKIKAISLCLVFLAYLLVMAPWIARNISVFGAPLTPGGNRTLWLTNYDQTYSYPASKLTMQAWLDSGWASIFKVRADALKWNLQTTLAVQGAIFLLPFILLGAWVYRHDLRVQIGIIAWLFTFLVMTIIFPFAGSRGGFLHSGAALQPLWWALAPTGIDRLVKWASVKRSWKPDEALKVFLIGSLGVSIMMSGLIFYERVYSPPGWGFESSIYRRVELFLENSKASADDGVIVGNPPGFYNVSNRPAIAVPNENLDTVLALAKRFRVHYLILDKEGVPKPLINIYDNPSSYSSIEYLGEIDDTRIFFIP